MPRIVVGVYNRVGDFQTPKELAVGGHKGIETADVFLAQRPGINYAAPASFEIFKNPRLREREFSLIAVQHLEHEDFVAMKAKLLESEDDVVGRLKEV